MTSLTLMCAVVIALNCNVAAFWYVNSLEESQPHRGQVIECSQEKTLLLSQQMKNVMCMPRDTLVKLVPPPGNTFYPTYARVKRCGGSCHSRKSCMAVDSNFTTVAVMMRGYNGRQCYEVSVEEHTDCKCQCSVKREHCKPYQRYSGNNCSCDCMKEPEICDSSRRMVWDEKMCKCICTKDSEEECSSGLEWVPSLCRCAMVMEIP